MSPNKASSPSSSMIPNKYFGVVVGLVVALLMFLGVQFFFRPLLAEINAKRGEQIVTAETNLQLRAEVLDRLQQSVELYQTIKLEEVSRIFEMVPAQSRESSLYQAMDELFSANGFRMDNISISEGPEQTLSKGGGSVKTLDLNISATGDSSYEAFKSLVSAIETHLRILDLSSISYLPNQGSYIFNLKAYYQE